MKIHFDSGVVEIELIDNEFVNSWRDNVSKMKMRETWNENLFPEVELSRQEVDDIRRKYSTKFDSHVDELKQKFNINFPGKMGIHKLSQARLNQLHLWVTHGAFTQSNWELPNATMEDINNSKWNHWKDYDFRADHEPEFEINPDDIEEITSILFEMNCDIHWYEETMSSPRAKQLREWGYEPKDGRHVIQRYTSGLDTAFDVLDIPNDFRKYCTYSTEPDLWLPFAVLGKEYYTCWVNCDNPSQFDITNIDKTYCPGWELQPNGFMTEVLARPEFQSWLTEHQVPTDAFCIGKIPLGYCTNRTDVNWDSVLQEQTIRVEWS